MKKWLVATVLAVAGCQTTATTSATHSEDPVLDPAIDDVAQELASQDCYGEANFCSARMPSPMPWLAGDPFPQSTPTTVVLLMRESPALWQVFGADPVAGKIHWRLSIKSSSMSSFMVSLGSTVQPYGGVRPPPVSCPPICIDPGTVLATALRTLSVQQQAQADQAACPIK
jgi:hypothetical protein